MVGLDIILYIHLFCNIWLDKIPQKCTNQSDKRWSSRICSNNYDHLIVYDFKGCLDDYVFSYKSITLRQSVSYHQITVRHNQIDYFCFLGVGGQKQNTITEGIPQVYLIWLIFSMGPQLIMVSRF